jgi:hypothetical protein
VPTLKSPREIGGRLNKHNWRVLRERIPLSISYAVYLGVISKQRVLRKQVPLSISYAVYLGVLEAGSQSELSERKLHALSISYAVYLGVMVVNRVAFLARTAPTNRVGTAAGCA